MHGVSMEANVSVKIFGTTKAKLLKKMNVVQMKMNEIERRLRNEY
tara:strand:+ start:864 stop:998 length:135 start_codon:yes stop_codon:yes gene_type:complete